MAQPKAVIFDLLTGLLNSWTVWDAVIPESERHITDGTTWRKRYLELAFACGVYKPYEGLVQQGAADVGLSPAAPEALFKRYLEIEPWPEVPEVLLQLKRQGLKLGIATNISDDLGRRVVQNTERVVREKTGSKDFTFDTVVTSEESGYYKPNPKPYQDVLNKLGLTPQEALFLAGSPVDIQGADGVGMKVCWNNHIGLVKKHNVEPLREGKDLREALQDFLLPQSQ